MESIATSFRSRNSKIYITWRNLSFNLYDLQTEFLEAGYISANGSRHKPLLGAPTKHLCTAPPLPNAVGVSSIIENSYDLYIRIIDFKICLTS